MEYLDLPELVQHEVLDFFKSREFINEQTENYALSELNVNSNTYPIFNTTINKIIFKKIKSV